MIQNVPDLLPRSYIDGSSAGRWYDCVPSHTDNAVIISWNINTKPFTFPVVQPKKMFHCQVAESKLLTLTLNTSHHCNCTYHQVQYNLFYRSNLMEAQHLPPPIYNCSESWDKDVLEIWNVLLPECFCDVPASALLTEKYLIKIGTLIIFGTVAGILISLLKPGKISKLGSNEVLELSTLFCNQNFPNDLLQEK